jgi:hypothetical protein
VILHRVFYEGGHDVLAAGEPRYDRALHQGNRPQWFVTWPGLRAPTRLVVEALDRGCPFPGHVGPVHVDDTNEPNIDNAGYIALDEARNVETGEVFINGQFDPSNRPRAIARVYVDASPAIEPPMDFFEGFDGEWPVFSMSDLGNGVYHYVSGGWDVELDSAAPAHYFAPMFDQLWLGMGDRGAASRFRMSPLGVDAHLSADPAVFLHVRMDVDLPSTDRRYPQLFVSTFAPPIQAKMNADAGDASTHGRTILVHTRSPPAWPSVAPIVAEIQFCDDIGWDVASSCPRASIYGRRLGDFEWAASHPIDAYPWTPAFALGDLSSFDRPVAIEVYVSIDRTYLFVESQPVGGTFLPAGAMPSGPVSVTFGAVIDHSAADSSVLDPGAPQEYLQRFSRSRTSRRFDSFGFANDVAPPSWDHARFPCGTEWIP